MKKSELRQIIREEIQRLTEANVNKLADELYKDLLNPKELKPEIQDILDVERQEDWEDGISEIISMAIDEMTHIYGLDGKQETAIHKKVFNRVMNNLNKWDLP